MDMDEKVRLVHQCSLRILEEIGIVVICKKTLELFKSNGFKVEGEKVFISKKQVEDALLTVPSGFEMKARNPKYSFMLDTKAREYAAGYGCAGVTDEDGSTRVATRNDYLKFLKLVESFDVFNVNGGILVQPGDIEAEHAPLVLLDDIITYSEKCIMTVPNEGVEMEHVMKMLEIVFGEGDLEKNCRAITLINTTSPLALDPKAMETLAVCAKYNQPVVVTPAPLCGTTGPILLASGLAMGNAEMLATIVAAQLYKKGMPLVYGVLTTPINLQNAACALGSPAYQVGNKYGTAMAHFYNMPVRNGGTQSDANMVGVQSGYESSFSLLASTMNGSNLLIHSAGILSSFENMSFEKFICDVEVIYRIEHYYKDMEVSDETLLFEDIKEVGPQGHFLLQESTLEYCHTFPWYNNIGLNEHLEDTTQYEARVKDNIRNRIENTVNSYVKPELDETIKSKLDSYVNEVCGKNYF